MNPQTTKRLAVAVMAVGLTFGGSTAAGATTGMMPTVQRPDSGVDSGNAHVATQFTTVDERMAQVGAHRNRSGVGFERPE